MVSVFGAVGGGRGVMEWLLDFPCDQDHMFRAALPG